MTAEIRRYQALLSNLNNLANTLQAIINELESAVTYSKIALNIGNTNYKQKDLEEMLYEVNSEYNNLVNVYIPEVRRKINELIEEQRRIEAARRAAEEAKRKEAEKKAKENDKN